MITIVVADDHAGFRRAVVSLLDGEDDMQVVGNASNGQDAVLLAGELNPAVVVMDVMMPILDGFEATRILRRDHPKCRTLALSSHPDDRVINRILAAGARGFVAKEHVAGSLRSAIRIVAAGDTYRTPRATTHRER
jgi:LuxR family maltose regulon positive regulatory protein